jgi:signal transduction histidine kinase
MDSTKFSIKNFFLSKLNRKLTLLFVIVGLIAPTISIFYFYNISVTSFTEEVTAEQEPLLRSVALTIIILITINSGIVGFFVSRSISKPIKDLYIATREVENGNYNVKLDIKTSDEIGKLALAFNRTSAVQGRLEEERKEIDSAKTEFLSITSHELRSPMTPMKAQLQMLEEGYYGKLSKKQKESLGIIIRNAERLDKIIVDFLDISRIEAARLKFNFQETNIEKLVKETTKFMLGYAKEKNIELCLNLDKLPEIEVDPDRVSQVLRNLINNAIKFSTEKSKIEIIVELKKEYILFGVRDYGCGLNSENQIRIFEPFYQVEGANRRRYGGTGLGLTICRGIIESQNGKIWIESKLGKGCKFNFTIPLKPVRQIRPIKILFSHKGTIEKKIREEFKSILGPLGNNEFDELKSKNALGRDDLVEYIDSLMEQYIIPNEQGQDFKNRVKRILGYENEVINEKEDKICANLGDEVLIRD